MINTLLTMDLRLDKNLRKLFLVLAKDFKEFFLVE